MRKLRMAQTLGGKTQYPRCTAVAVSPQILPDVEGLPEGIGSAGGVYGTRCAVGQEQLPAEQAPQKAPRGSGRYPGEARLIWP
jgi:hypothetical protein